MKHSFISSNINQSICSVCHKIESVHGITECECCAQLDDCEIVNGMLMCSICRDKELSVKSVVPPVNEPTLEQIVFRANQIVDSPTFQSALDLAIKGNIDKYTDFFNANMPSIISLKELIDSSSDLSDEEKRYELAKALGNRIKHLTAKLFEARIAEVQLGAEVKSIQHYMNELIPQLRKELRIQFGISNPNFIPPVKDIKQPKVRLSAEDRLAEGYAKLMKVSIEQAKILMANKLRKDCTCKETPGICKVHK